MLCFVIMPEGYAHEMMAQVDSSVLDIKHQIQKDLDIAPEHVTLKLTGQTMMDDQSLEQAGVEAGGKCTIELRIDVLKADALPPGAGLPPVLKVVVSHGPGNEPASYLVQIDNEADGKSKPFLGGFNSISTGGEYHHASTNTVLPPNPELMKAPKNHREAQTAIQRRSEGQSTRESGTQMLREDLSLQHHEDVVIIGGPYFDSEQLNTLRLERAIRLQAVLRGWFARKARKKLKGEALDAERHRLEYERAMQKEADLKRQQEIERRMHPRSKHDFEVLYRELEAWRLQETQKINEDPDLSVPERKVALAQVLNKEVKLLQTIDRLKLSAAEENKSDTIEQTLSGLADSKKWGMSDGSLKEVDTPFTLRARELLELYHGLSAANGSMTVDERLDVLLHVKWTVKEFDCRLTRDLVDLIDREADMINRGRPETSLEGLRRRTQSLFLHFIETPEFNPEAAKLEKVPRDFNARPYVKPIMNDFVQAR